jgi:hypothetical protein
MKKSLLLAFLAIALNVFAQNKPAHSSPQDPTKNIAQPRGSQSELTKKLNALYQDLNIAEENQYSSKGIRDLVQRIDSVYSWRWDSTSYDWALDSKISEIQYNDENSPTSLTIQLWTGTSWENSFQLITNYDGNNNETLSQFKTWTGSAWANVFQSIYTYDGNNNRISEISQIWFGVDWMNTTLYAFTYDGNHNVLSETDSQWDGVAWRFVERHNYTYVSNNLTMDVHQYFEEVSANWINADQLVYTYDGNHNQLTNTYQIWNGFAWDNSSKGTSTYDGNNNRITSLSQTWDGTQWVNLSNAVHTYGANNLWLTSLIQNWNGASYDNASSTSNQYDGNLLIKSLLEIWDGSSWNYSALSLYTYGEGDYLQSESTRYYDGDQDLITEGDSSYYYFKTVAGTKDLIADDGTVSANPNPSTGKFTLTSLGNINEIEIFNMLGERVYTARYDNGASSSEINMSGYARGVYMILVKDGSKVSSKKIMIQ